MHVGCGTVEVPQTNLTRSQTAPRSNGSNKPAKGNTFRLMAAPSDHGHATGSQYSSRRHHSRPLTSTGQAMRVLPLVLLVMPRQCNPPSPARAQAHRKTGHKKSLTYHQDRGLPAWNTKPEASSRPSRRDTRPAARRAASRAWARTSARHGSAW